MANVSRYRAKYVRAISEQAGDVDTTGAVGYTQSVKTEAVVYDLDGTIADTERFHVDAWDCVVKKYGLPMDALGIHRASLGISTIRTLTENFPGMCEDLVKAVADDKYAFMLGLLKTGEVRVMPGFCEALGRLRAVGVKIGICTSARRENVEALGESTGRVGEIIRSLRGRVVWKEMCVNGKPSAEPLLRAIGKLGGCSLDKVVYVGDAAADRQCAEGAGVRYFHFVDNGGENAGEDGGPCYTNHLQISSIIIRENRDEDGRGNPRKLQVARRGRASEGRSSEARMAGGF